MTSLDLLVKLGYVPYAIVSLFKGGDFSQNYLQSLTQWATIHQVLCLVGGFLWLAATVCYARRSADACLYCGRREGVEGWQGPTRPRRAGPPCTWRWLRQFFTPLPVTPGRWGSRWG